MLAALVLPLLCGRVWRTHLVEGYQQQTKFLANFAFAASTQERPASVKLTAWTFMDHQKVLLFKNDEWFRWSARRASDLDSPRLAHRL